MTRTDRNTKTAPKLQLRRQVLRELTTTDLRAVAAGSNGAGGSGGGGGGTHPTKPVTW